MITPCELKQQPAQPVLSVRTTTSVADLPSVMGNAYMTIFQHLAGLGKQPAGSPFVTYYNMDMNNLDIEIGYPVEGSVAGAGEVRATEIPAETVAMCEYTGPYQEMPPAYDALQAWVEEHGYTPTGVTREIYLNDPSVTPPQELRTRIIFPLQA